MPQVLAPIDGAEEGKPTAAVDNLLGVLTGDARFQRRHRAVGDANVHPLTSGWATSQRLLADHPRDLGRIILGPFMPAWRDLIPKRSLPHRDV